MRSTKIVFILALFSFFSSSLYAADRAFINVAKLWPDSEVPVCFMELTQENAHAREVMEKAITGTWQKFSNLKFTGWDKCGDKKTKGISIIFDESNPRAHMGVDSNYMHPSMYMNYSFKTWSPSCGKSEKDRDRCVRVIAVHEFGHAIGFKHEQVREDTPTWCKAGHGGSSSKGGVTVGKWDKDSVMNYCNPTWSGNGVLSASDIAALKKFYGKPDPKDGMTIELSINDKQHSADLQAGDQAKFSFRANQEGWVYFIGMTDTKESKVRYLLNVAPEGSDGLKLLMKITKKQVGKWISLGSFEVGGPFGEERIIAVAAKKDLSLPDFEEDDRGLIVITEKVTLENLQERATKQGTAISIIQMTTKP